MLSGGKILINHTQIVLSNFLVDYAKREAPIAQSAPHDQVHNPHTVNQGESFQAGFKFGRIFEVKQTPKSKPMGI